MPLVVAVMDGCLPTRPRSKICFNTVNRSLGNNSATVGHPTEVTIQLTDSAFVRVLLGEWDGPKFG